MTVSEELKPKVLIRRKAWELFRRVRMMRERLPAEDEDASRIMQEADDLQAKIERLLESEELKANISLYAEGLFACVTIMRDRLPAGDEVASKITQEADGLCAEIKDLLEIEE